MRANFHEDVRQERRHENRGGHFQPGIYNHDSADRTQKGRAKGAYCNVEVVQYARDAYEVDGAPLGGTETGPEMIVPPNASLSKIAVPLAAANLIERTHTHQFWVEVIMGR